MRLRRRIGRLAWYAIVLVAGCSDGDDSARREAGAGAAGIRVVTHPQDGARAVPVGAWAELRVEPADAAAALDEIDLVCGEEPHGVRVHRLTGGRIVVQPVDRLPSERACRLAWTRSGLRESIGFTTFRPSESPGRGVAVAYRRSIPGELAPIPDDFWTRADPSSPTGIVLDLPTTLRPELREVVEGLRGELVRADGWSPVGPIVLPLTDRIDPASIPRSATDSLDPTATIALVDVDPRSPARGTRWPFEAILRRDRTGVGLEEHALWILPARPLAPGGRYALLVRRGAATKSGRSMSEPLALRPIFDGEPAPTPGPQALLAELLAPAIATARTQLAIPWTQDDLVFALVFTVKRLDGLARDPEALRADVAALAGPRVEILRVETIDEPGRPIAALVHGRFATPLWRERRTRPIARDADGRPRPVGRDALRFVLALPARAAERPVPLLVYQHGNPGSAREEIGSRRHDAHLEAGFAVVGFTDLWNRGRAPAGIDRRQVVVRQVAVLVDAVRRRRFVPDDWLVTLGEQLSLLAALPELAALDLLPVDAPDGRPELDASLPYVYEGVSQGAIHGQALLAYADRIEAASLVVGGARLAELALHQAAGQMVKALPILFGEFRPIDLWVTLALFQAAIDRQDPQLHAMQSARRPRPSVLVTAGLDDGYVANRASRSLAAVLGPLAWLEGPPDAAGFGLPAARAPLRGNLEGGGTGAYVEVVPYGSERPSAPGCSPEAMPLPEEWLREGHFCAQLAAESIRRRVEFLRSAIEDAPPTVVDPLPAEWPAKQPAKRPAIRAERR